MKTGQHRVSDIEVGDVVTLPPTRGLYEVVAIHQLDDQLLVDVVTNKVSPHLISVTARKCILDFIELALERVCLQCRSIFHMLEGTEISLCAICKWTKKDYTPKGPNPALHFETNDTSLEA